MMYLSDDEKRTQGFISKCIHYLLIVSLIIVILLFASNAMATSYYGYQSVPTNSYDSFRNTVNGNWYDVDVYADLGAQCWDGASLFWWNVTGTYLRTGPHGIAKECWNYSREYNAGTNFFLITDLGDVQRGDVIIFDGGSLVPTGHVGFADEDYTEGMTSINLLGQNQRSNDQSFCVAPYSLETFLGAFRYVGWADRTAPTFPDRKMDVLNIRSKGFTVSCKAEDNRGIISAWATAWAMEDSSRRADFPATYDSSTNTITVDIDIEQIGYLGGGYALSINAKDKSGNIGTLRSITGLSPYEMNVSENGTYKAITDAQVYIAPYETFNGISTRAYVLEKNEQRNVIGSYEENGVKWYRLESYVADQWVLASQMTRISAWELIWNSITSALTGSGSNAYIVDENTYYSSSGGNSLIIAGVYSYTLENLNLGDPTASDPDAVTIDETSFPDSAFRGFISDNFDINQDGVLSPEELKAVSEITLTRTTSVRSLEGIEHFENLETLDCSNQSINTLDLSSNPALLNLKCSGNGPMSLNISQNTALRHLECNSISLPLLDLSLHQDIEYVSCAKQGAFQIVLGDCPNLRTLYCEGNGLTSLDVSGCPALETLSCGTNNLTTLSLANNTRLTYLNCNNNQYLSSIDVSRCSNLVELYCRFCSLSQIDVSNNLELNEFWCCGNSLVSLDVSHNLKLGHLYCVENQLDVLDVTHNPALWGLSCGLNQLTELDLSNNPLLNDLSCYGNQIPFIDLSDNPELTGLRIYDNNLTSIDLTNNDKLSYVWAENNGIEVDSYVDLNNLPGFDMTRISNITGGILVGHHLLLTEETVHYDYECNETYTINFFLTGEPESVIDSGTCGSNVSWVLYSNGLLLITGEGEMNPFYLKNNAPRCTAPWFVYESEIKMVYVDQGVTNVSSNAFWNCSALQSVYLSTSVNSIADRAFCACPVLEDIIIPPHVNTIGEFAFLCCTNLSQITIPASVTSIGEGAFSSSGIQIAQIDANISHIPPSMFSACGQLETVILPDTVITIGDQAFSSCKSLKNIDIPNGVVTIGNGSFNSCYNLESFTIPDTVTTIGDSAFSFCRSLTSINIPSGILRIQTNTFGSCESLSSIAIPEGVTEIGKSAFQGCSSLTNINIPISVMSIGERAFANSGLTSITIPVNVADIGYSAFSTNSLTEFHVNADNQYFSVENNALYNKDRTKLIAIPKEWTSLVIPEGVTEIGAWACYGCKLENVKMPNSLITIGAYAFESCWRVDHFIIPGNVTTIGTAAFWWCEMSSVTIPKSVTTISGGAFDECGFLNDVYYTGNEEEWASINIGSSNGKLLSATIHYNSIPGVNDESIIASGTCGDSAFWKLDTDGTLTVYGSGDINTKSFIPYEHREKVKNVIIETGITGIGNYTFHGCGNLLTVQLPEGLTYIGGQAFEYCEELTSINIPASLKQIGSFAFAFCRKLNTLILPENVSTTVFTRMYEGTLIEITLPSSVEELQYGAFIEAVGVGQRINISIDFDVPEFVNIIDAEAFEGISATAVSVFTKWDRSLEINSRAFANCKRLQYFWIYGEGPEELHIADDAFAGCNGTMTIISGFIEDSLAEQLEQYASEHGFQYLENEKYWGNG